MRCISLHQPWATLIAIGAKQFETRDWTISYRGPIAIHAAKLRTKDQAKLMYGEPFKSVLRAAGYTQFEELPFGCVIAIGEITHVFDSTALKTRLVEMNNRKELAFGNYQPNRYCWWIQHVEKITPVPAKGEKGLWNWLPNQS